MHIVYILLTLTLDGNSLPVSFHPVSSLPSPLEVGRPSLICSPSSLPQPFLFLLQDSLYGFPRLFTVTSEHIRLFYFLVFFCVYTFLVVGSVR